MAGGLSAGSVRTPRRPRHLFPSGVTRPDAEAPSRLQGWRVRRVKKQHRASAALAEEAVPGRPAGVLVGA